MTSIGINCRIINNDTESGRLLNKYFVPTLHDAYIEIGRDRYCLPISYEQWAEKLNQFHIRDDDTFVLGFPRSGTTWTQEMVWLILNDLNFEGAKERQIKRVPLLELDVLSRGNTSKHRNSALLDIDMLTHINGLKSPRCIKSHLHWALLPSEISSGSKHPKMIVLLRNPKDVCVSYYNLYRLFNGYTGSFEDFCLLFLEGRVLSGPFWETVLSFWEQRHLPNMLFIKYKDMKEDLIAVMKRVANFLGKKLNESDIVRLSDHLNIENMRNNPSINREDALKDFAKPFKRMISDKNDFIGKGEHNGYLSIMSLELINKFDEWSKKHLEGTDLTVD